MGLGDLMAELLGEIEGSRGMCVQKGGQCYANHPCCAGLQCVPASTRAFCQ
jgi:hypothetical protein